MKNSGLDFLLGTEVGYFFSGTSTIKCEGDGCTYFQDSQNTEEIDADDWEEIGGSALDYGLVFGAKFNITPKLSAVGTYYLGLVEWGENSDDELTTYYGAGDFTHRAFQIYLSYGL